jgi:large subunit ribosomal protein L30
MLQKTKDYITWGEINEETLMKLLTYTSPNLKGNMETVLKDLLTNKKKFQEIANPVIRLHPPLRGYRGIKKPYSMGGSLGYRGKEINELIMRMV